MQQKPPRSPWRQILEGSSVGDISPHFSTSELACHHCQRCSVTGEFVLALENLRSQGSEPIIIHDGYRCPEHNLAVHGVPHSEHVEGLAADLEIVGLTLQQMYDRANKVPEFRDGGIGVYREAKR
jgi:hypothetical protein